MPETRFMKCQYCGYEWRPRKGGRKCPFCFRVLGENRSTKWKLAEKKLADALSKRGWKMEKIGGQKVIDILAERGKRKLLLDVKSGESYLIRHSQLKELSKHVNKKTDVGFACEMDGKFYLFMLTEVL